jgi:hypothetical protein
MFLLKVKWLGSQATGVRLLSISTVFIIQSLQNSNLSQSRKMDPMGRKTGRSTHEDLKSNMA